MRHEISSPRRQHETLIVRQEINGLKRGERALHDLCLTIEISFSVRRIRSRTYQTMASEPLVYTLASLTATILVLLILWIVIRYTKHRRARSQNNASRLQVEQDATYAAEHGESTAHLHCTYQPSGATHSSNSHLSSDHTVVTTESVELQTLVAKEDEGDKAEVWLKRGASRDNLRRVSEEGVIGTRTVRGWDMMSSPTRQGLEGAGRR